MRILEPEKRYSLNVKFEGENYSFLAEIADPSTELDIEIAVAKRLNGASLESIPNSVYGYLIAIETLNHVIKEIPVNLQIRFNSFEKIRDKEFVVRLFNEYKKKENWFLAELKKKSGHSKRRF